MCEQSDMRKPALFDRVFFEASGGFKRIGGGEIGGKAAGLNRAREILTARPYEDESDRLRIVIPSTVVVATDVFEAFMERNGLHEYASSGSTDERIVHKFVGGDFPVENVGDLRALVEGTGGNPLAVRSSSLLEDALAHPFAGVYQTKMIPNNHPDPNTRFKRLLEAIKFVYASAYFRDAANYVTAIGKDPAEERMAVVIQEVVGRRFGERFYPQLSGVCRSFNFYRSGSAKPEEGVVNLALGLGKTIVDGGVNWSYSPAHPKSRPPFASTADMLNNTQLRFWAVNVGPTPPYDPTKETEHLVESDLAKANYDDTLRHLASTFDSTRDRLVPGVGINGPRVLDFAPILQLELWPVNDAIRFILDTFERETNSAVEIEFAVTFPERNDGPARLAVLQVRPMLVSKEPVDVPESTRENANLLAFSQRVMGNGKVDGLLDIVYVKPETFERQYTPQIAADLESLNHTLREARRPYVLIGFGRWGSSDPWLGIPVTWAQISGAAVIVEATLPDFDVEPSQGTHFFHNIASFQISYFSVHHQIDPAIDWDWLSQQRVTHETELVRHIESTRPLAVAVDGRTGRGAIWHGASEVPIVKEER
jgi:hypothetical protein